MKPAAPLLAVSAILLSTIAFAQPTSPTTPAAPTPNCQSSCTVTIVIPAGCGSGIRVSPDPITVPPGNSTTISWTIATPGWSFAPDGIFIHGLATPTGYARYAFEKNPERQGASSFRVRHSNQRPAAFKYDINLIGPGERPCKLDPTILDW